MRTRGQRAERGPAPARQRAAGVIPLRRTPDGWRLLVLRAYRNWDFPKGLLQPDESPLEAALREAREEAGLVDLRFPWGTEGYQTAPYGRGKVATYFLAETSQAQVELLPSPELGRPEHHEARWVSFEQAAALLPPRLQPVLHWARARLGTAR